MFRLLLVIALVGTAWATSHHLTRTTSDFDSPRPRVALDAPAAATGTRTVALLDFAVAALPRSEPARPAAAVEPGPIIESAAPEPPETEVLPVAEATDPVADARLARRLQKELRRVGCLKSAVDGVWGPSSQRAMQRFADRINATLPTDRPDGVLLMLVEKYEDRACGPRCGAGEQPDARGRCRRRDEVASLKADPVSSVSLTAAASVSIAEPAAPSKVETSAIVTGPEAKARPVKTSIARGAHNKRPRVVRAKRLKTVWSAPAYGLGMPRERAPAAAKRKRKRVGASAAYRRWMTRTGVTMR